MSKITNDGLTRSYGNSGRQRVKVELLRLPFVSWMLMSLPMSRVLEICVNLFFVVDSDVVELRCGTTGGTFCVGVAVLSTPASGDPLTPDNCGGP